MELDHISKKIGYTDHISKKIGQAGGNRKSDIKKISHVTPEAPSREYLWVTENIERKMGLQQVIEIPTITAPNDGEEAQDVHAESTTNTETRNVSDWSWTNVEKCTKISGNSDSE
jgi:hypothetical protein